jgi:hypothetical protein
MQFRLEGQDRGADNTKSAQGLGRVKTHTARVRSGSWLDPSFRNLLSPEADIAADQYSRTQALRSPG